MRLSSFLMGAVLFLASPIAIVLAVLVWRFADTGPQVVLLHAWLAGVGVLIGVFAGLASVMSGFRALRFARRRRQPSGMAAAGLFLGLLGGIQPLTSPSVGPMVKAVIGRRSLAEDRHRHR